MESIESADYGVPEDKSGDGRETEATGRESSEDEDDENVVIPEFVSVSKFRSTWMDIGQDYDTEDETDDDESNRGQPTEEEENDEEEEPVVDADNENESQNSSMVPPNSNGNSQCVVPPKRNDMEVVMAYQTIPDREKYQEHTDWAWESKPGLTDTEEGTKLRKLLELDTEGTLGQCFYVGRVEDDAPRVQVDPAHLSMIRLIDYCDMNQQTNGRGFIDGLLDIVHEEMKNNGFNLATRPRRETVSRLVMRKYGMGCEPEVAHLTIASERGNAATVEETAKVNQRKETDEVIGLDPEQLRQSELYKSIPQQVEGRRRHVADVIRFNFRKQVINLLSDYSIFGKLQNLVVNSTNPFLPYVNTSAVVDEFMDGTWYPDTVQRLKSDKTDPFVDGLDFALPMVVYLDKTGTSGNQRHPLEPVLFTTAIIKRKIRNQTRSWRPLGYIPDLESKSSAEKRYLSTKNSGATSQSYHVALEYLLELFQEAQNEGIVTWLRLGDHIKKVRLRPELMCIINDGKSADMLTSRYSSTHHDKRISRSCCTLQADADDVSKQCQFLELDKHLTDTFRVIGMSEQEIQEDPQHQVPTAEGLRKPTLAEVRETVEKAKKDMEAKSLYPVRNAFVSKMIRFGFDARHVWGANPVDLMHAFQSGVLMYVVKMVLDNLAPRQQVRLDRLVDKLFHPLRSGRKKDYPRMNFSKGFSKLTMLTSDEWAGKLFVILLVLYTEEGKEIFKSSFNAEDVEVPESMREKEKDLDSDEQVKDMNRFAAHIEQKEQEERRKNSDSRKTQTKEDDAEEMIRKCSKSQFTELAEALLTFHAWYKMGLPKCQRNGKPDTGLIHRSVAHMMAMIRFYTPRKKGNGWKIQKFHDLLHLAIDIERFGSPANFDAGPHESGLRYWAKLPALSSQKRGYNTFAKQVAARTHEFQCMAYAMRCNGVRGVRDKDVRSNSTECNDAPPEGRLGGTRFRVYTTPEANETGRGIFPPSKAIRGKETKSSFVVPNLIEDYLRFQPKDMHDQVIPTTDGDEIYWELRTELTVVLPNETQPTTIRCHPNYMNAGGWYDWVMVEFELGELVHKPENKNKFLDSRGKEKDWDPIKHNTQYFDNCVPCKVLAFTVDNKTGETKALVHGCNFRTKGEHVKQDTVLVEFWNLAYHDLHKHLPEHAMRKKAKTKQQNGYFAPQLSWVPVSSILCTCLVVEEEPGLQETITAEKWRRPDSVMLVRKRALWPAEFTTA